MATLDEWLDGNLAVDETEDNRPGSPLSPIQRHIQLEQQSPDEAASDAQIGETIGRPRQAVTQYRDVFSRAAEAQRIQQSTESSPRLRSWLEAHPDNLAVARDDVEPLSFFERLANDVSRRVGRMDVSPRGLSNVLRNMPARDQIAFDLAAANPLLAPLTAPLLPFAGRGAGTVVEANRQGNLDVEFGALAYRAQQAVRGRGPALGEEDRARLDELSARPGQENWGPFIVGPTARLLPQIVGSFERGLREAPMGAEETLAQFYGDEATRRETARRVLSGQASAQEALWATGMAPVAGVAATLGAFGRGAGGYLSFGYEQETGQFFDQAVRAGADPAIAAERAEQYGAWSTALEFALDAFGIRLSGAGRLAARTLFGDALGVAGGTTAQRGAQQALGAVAGTAASQSLEETSQQLAQIIHQDLAVQETETGRSDLSEAWKSVLTPENIQAMLQAGYIGAQGGAGMASVPAALNLALDARAIAEAESNRAVFEALGSGATSSALGARLPSAMQGAVSAMTEGTPLESVRIDARAWAEHFQAQGADPAAVARELGFEDLAQAISSGGDVVIPTGVYAARVAPGPHHAALTQHMRLRPDDYTQAEMETAQAQLQASVAEIAQQADESARDSEIGTIVEERVKALFARAEAEGGPRPEVAARYAKLAAALPRTLLARARSIDPDYAARLEPQLKGLFDRLDIAGPTRSMGRSFASVLEEESAAELPQPKNQEDRRAEDERVARGEIMFPLEAFHGTATEPRFIKHFGGLPFREFHSWSHFGSRKAAEHAARKAAKRSGKGTRRFVMPVRIDPGEIIDLPLDSGVAHQPWMFVIALERAGYFTPEERAYINEPFAAREAAREADPALRGFTFEGYAPSDVAADRAAEVLDRKGIKAIRYTNTIEDPGSVSYVIPSPKNIRSIAAQFDAEMRESANLLAQEGQAPAAQRFGSDEEIEALRAEIESTEPGAAERILSSTVFRRIEEHADTQAPTMRPEDASSETFWRSRRYIVDGEEKTLGETLPAIRRMFEATAQGEVARNRQAVMVLGHPGAGKSTFIKALAKAQRAAFVDCDAVKSLIPEYEGGVNTQAVHAESSFLRKLALDSMLPDGLNLVVERVGDEAAAVNRAISDLRANGYRVRLVHVNVNADEAVRRMAARFLAVGRYVEPQAYRRVLDKPAPVFGELVANSAADGYVEVDANGPIGEAKITRADGSEDLATAIRQARLTDGFSPDADARGKGGGGGGPGGESGQAGLGGPDRRSYASTGRRTPPDQIPDPGTPEWAQALQEANDAQARGDRLTPLQRAMLRWEKEGGELGQSSEGQFYSALGRAVSESKTARGRGSILYDKFRAGEFGDTLIRLGQSSDLSTFLHEFGHLGHLVLESIATDESAPAEFKDMWNSTLQWWGLSQEQWSAMSTAEKTPYFEQWARSFEAYLMEGKAPSLSLKEAFATFKAWLVQLYKTVFALDANLTPEIRDVFDRLLATDAEIAEARAVMGADKSIPKEMFKTEAEYQAYLRAVIDAKDAQEAELRARVFDAQVRKGKRWWRAERGRVREDAIRNVDEDPARRAHDWLAFGDQRTDGEAPPPMLLSAQALAEDWPDVVLPPALNPRIDPETVLAEAMRLKRAGKDKRAQRIGAFVRANGGINLSDLPETDAARIREAIGGSGRNRPGLINNATGKSAQELMDLATAAGYFGEPAATELGQGFWSRLFGRKAPPAPQGDRLRGNVANAGDDAAGLGRNVGSNNLSTNADMPAAARLRQFLQDDTPIAQRLTVGDRIVADGRMADIIGADETSLHLRDADGATRTISRNNSSIEVPPPDQWPGPQGNNLPQSGDILSRNGDEGVDLGQSDRLPTLEEFLDTLIADLRGERQVYSARDAGALSDTQNIDDARRWFDAHDIDLTKDKENIRAQVIEALERDKNDPNAMHPDDVAPWFGYSSGDELVKALAALKPRAQAIEEETDRLLAEEHGDAGSQDRIQQEAQKAAHTEAQARRIELELAAIERASGTRGRSAAVSAARAYAEETVQGLTIREIRNHDKYLASERRAARAAFEALQNGDAHEAALAKQRQLLSFRLYSEARKAAENLDKIQRRWKRYSESAGARKAIGARHIEQIDAILDSIETGRPQFQPTQTLQEWAEALNGEGVGDDMLVFNPAVIEQQIKRPLAQMNYADVLALNDALRNIEAIGRGVVKLRNAQEAQRIDDIKTGLKGRIEAEWSGKLRKRQSLVAPDAADKGRIALSNFHAQLLKMDYLARMLDGLKDGGPWMNLMAMTQDAENDLHTRSQAATMEFLGLVRAHYTPKQFRDMLTKRIFIPALDDNRTKLQIISYALNLGTEYNKSALLRGEGWTEEVLDKVLAPLDRNDYAFVQSLWNYVGQWKEESFALDERTRGSRPAEVAAQPFTAPDGSTWAGGYWPVAFDTQRSDLAAQRDARETVIGQYGAGFRQAATQRGRLKARRGTKGQPLSSDFMGVLAKHVHDSLRDITHRELVITLRRVKADKEIRDMVARVAGRDAVRALDEWVYRLADRTPAAAFGDYGKLPAYLRRSATGFAMGFKVSVATLNLLGHLQAVPRNGVIAQMKQAGLSVAVGFPDLLRRNLMAIATGRKEVSQRVRFVYERSEMMRHRRNSFDRDIAEVKGDIVGRRDGSILPKNLEDMLQYLNQLTDQVVSVPTWLAAYESALNGHVKGVDGEKASAEYADHVVRTTLSAGASKDLAALIASNNQWQRLATMFMGWASAFYNQLFAEQFPGVASGKISVPKFAANMVWIWLLPAAVTTIFYGQAKRRDDEDEAEYWARMAAMGGIYPLQTIPFVRDLLTATVMGYQPQTPISAVYDRSTRLKSAIEREDERQMVKQGVLLAGQLTGLPTAQGYVTGDYLYDLARGEEDPLADPVDALEEAFLRDTR